MKIKKTVLLIIVFLILNGLFAFADDGFKANVMVYNTPEDETPVFNPEEDWASFEEELAIAKSIGVDAVSIDVWWGDVEGNGDDDFDWSYYQTAFTKITDAGLRIVPIMSFHQCGGNVGDDYTSLLPSWIWDTIRGTRDVEDMKYKSELGYYSNEYVSLWADNFGSGDYNILNQYRQFMEAFASFSTANGFADDIDEINISLGPSGELRYPSYNQHDYLYDPSTKTGFWEYITPEGTAWRGDRTNWPHRGAMQNYGELALEDFQYQMGVKYSNITNLKMAWGKYADGVESFDQITMPNSGTAFVFPDGAVFKAEDFFQSGDYYKTQYGRDLIEWYNQSLINHGDRMIDTAAAAFYDAPFNQIELGIKIPGIHWQMGSLGEDQATAPRAAEIAAGLISISSDFINSFDLGFEADTNGHGYEKIISNLKNQGREVALHFTCLEMGNGNGNYIEMTDPANPDATIWLPNAQTPTGEHSLARALVGWVAMEAFSQDVIIKGENALAGNLPWAGEFFPGICGYNYRINRRSKNYSFTVF